MPAVFRYSEERYAASLLERGNTRVGTLYDFRKSEHRQGISDPQEGKKRVGHYIERATEQDLGGLDMKAIDAYGMFTVEPGAAFTFHNLTMVNDYDQPDCFIHCCSTSYSLSAMRGLGGADACVEIFDPVGFYMQLTKSMTMQVQVRLECVETVKYTARDQEWNGVDWGDHPSLIKEPIYAPQKEMRVVWSPVFSQPIEPLIIDDAELRRFCRRVPIPKR